MLGKASRPEWERGPLCYASALWTETINSVAKPGIVSGRTFLLVPGIPELLATLDLVSAGHLLQSFLFLWSAVF